MFTSPWHPTMSYNLYQFNPCTNSQFCKLIPLSYYAYCIPYSGKFLQGSIFADGQSFCGLIYADVLTHAHYILYNRVYMCISSLGLIFVIRHLSSKIGPLEIFLLYGMKILTLILLCVHTHCT